MSDAPRIVARPGHGTTPRAGLDALSAIYRRAIARYEEKQRGGPETAPDDAKGFEIDRATRNPNR